MKTYLKYGISGLTVIAFIFSMSSCSAPAVAEENSTPLSTENPGGVITENKATDPLPKADEKNASTPLPKPGDKTVVAPAAEAVVKPTPLTLSVTNLASPTAPIIVRVYQQKHKFMDRDDKYKYYRFIPNGNSFTTQLTDLGYGEYGLVVYQDMNDNGKVDKDWVGLPQEGFAFSNNFRPKMRAPTFDECKFQYNANFNNMSLKIIQ